MKKILLIDDDMASLKGLQMCFAIKKFPTVCATNVSEAKRLLDTEEISLVCTDEESYERSALEQGAVRYYIKGQFSYLKFRDDLIELANRE